ncbi:hypothetical protein ACOT81_34610 [Streptomyces sp. WI04-05B]|uniref:hypothetical protein n=1 Tax=Streptomyces TaxID=1883 RepID=UPI0029B4FD30|nr:MULTISPECIES: hypothetical protein [unclassified Streptomyces]MDX2541996.1 hypothetical protein [Streptomyces sp. WI04-05B]MDX2587078.1 hypothetical protein [Streptomyces sp. WI04-05A]
MKWWRGRERKPANENPRQHARPPQPPQDPQPEHSEDFDLRLGGLSHAFAVLDPSTTIGPDPVHIPLTGHNVYLDLAATGDHDLVLLGLRAEVTGRAPMKPSGVSLVPQPGPALSYAEDLSEARRRALANYQPMQVPDAEVFLDETPPLVRPALDGQGIPVVPDFGLPLRIPAGTAWRIVLAPHTEDRGRVEWRLFADVTCGDFRGAVDWELKVTAETTMRAFRPGGTAPEFTPVHVIAPHWRVARPPKGSP